MAKICPTDTALESSQTQKMGTFWEQIWPLLGIESRQLFCYINELLTQCHHGSFYCGYQDGVTSFC